MKQYKLLEYIEDGKSFYADWFNSLDAITAARIDKYVRRMEQGNMWDSKVVGGGVLELHIDYGPGNRVYYGKDRDRLVILLGGGSKRYQSKDIARAICRWKAYKKRRK
ncbi:MAG: type II toxin-antitoxin system RelE/ParE family toxin [Planctomycetes bacterium]|nr:type II toxin-antitoxin system RelE/ParE family toxin [Planctomycetota bacterium]